MADQERQEDLVPRSELEAAVARAEQAEQALDGPKRAARAGVPGELTHLWLGSDATSEEIERWLESFNEYVETVTEQIARERRPDWFRGRNMVIQHAKIPGSTGRPPLNGSD